MITKSWASLASLLFLFLLIAQFIAYFDFSNIAQVVGDLARRHPRGRSTSATVVAAARRSSIVTMVVNIIMPAKIAKWAILAPIFVPLMLRLGVEPQTVLAAYRVGDSPINVLTPLMPYFPLMVVFAARYQKDAGIGTVIALMMPVRDRRRRSSGRSSSCSGTCSASRSGPAGRSEPGGRRWRRRRSRSSSSAARSRCSCGTGCRSRSSRSARRWRCAATGVIARRRGVRGLRRPDGHLHRVAVRGQRGARRDGGDDVGGAAAGRGGGRSQLAAGRVACWR